MEQSTKCKLFMYLLCITAIHAAISPLRYTLVIHGLVIHGGQGWRGGE